MSLTLPIPEFIGPRRPAKRPATTVRCIPEPKAFAMPVIWEETPAPPSSVPLLLHPATSGSARHIKTVTRLRIPLELRLDLPL